METLHPGVYIEGVSGGNRPIEGARNSITAFIGVTEKGPVDHALMVASFAEFQANFGNFLRESWLACSVLLFFNNGGTHLYIARVTGHEGATPQEIDYQKAFTLLDPIIDIDLIAVPGMGTPSMVSYGSDYCQKRGDCFFIGDIGLSDNTKENAQAFIDNIKIRNSYAAIYFPWLKMKAPSGYSSEAIAVPPSGYVSAIYVRTDARAGVWKTGSFPESNINGAVGLLVNISDHEQNTLYCMGINSFRIFSDKGVVIYGIRTLTTHPGHGYKYIPVRRTEIFLKQNIYNGISWAVFEPNDPSLWARIRLNINGFMMQQFRAGAFSGSTAREAFFVKCDSETTTHADIEAGIVNILIGFAPIKPSEFLILKISQITGQ